MFISISNTPRPYAWGSRTAISEFLGTEPTAHPQAELWLGAHSANPARIQDSQIGYANLAEMIEGQQQAPLPFLLKILAAQSPLSLQAHPTSAQAALGFEAEERAGVPVDAPHRNYKDPYAKPEIVVALSEQFHALSGFRPLEEVAAILGVLRLAAQEKGIERLSPLELLETLLESKEPLKTTLGVLLGGEYSEAVAELTALVVRLSSSRVATGSKFAASFATVQKVAAEYPGDPGIVLTLLLNHVTLRRGEALFLDAGNIHAYLHGLGVELMGPSDNVLRGGLTPKHVDVPELMQVLDFTPMSAPYLEAEATAENVLSYLPEGTGFALHRLNGQAQITLPGTCVAIMESGELELSGAHSRRSLNKGQALYLSAEEEYLRTSGDGVLWVAAPAQ